jgi:hypothetical protein
MKQMEWLRERVENIGRVCVRLVYAEKNQDSPTATKTIYSVVNKAEDKMQRQSSRREKRRRLPSSRARPALSCADSFSSLVILPSAVSIWLAPGVRVWKGGGEEVCVRGRGALCVWATMSEWRGGRGCEGEFWGKGERVKGRKGQLDRWEDVMQHSSKITQSSRTESRYKRGVLIESKELFIIAKRFLVVRKWETQYHRVVLNNN